MKTIKKILIVDDNFYDRELLSIFIKRNSECQIIFAENGRDGIEKIVTESPDVVFLDVSLPKMDGFQLLMNLKAHFPDMNPKIIPVSVFSDAATITKFFMLGIEDYIVKPLSLSNNFGKIEKIFNQLEQTGSP